MADKTIPVGKPDELSAKSRVIGIVFEQRWNPVTSILSSAAVSLGDVERAIRRYNRSAKKKLSSKNPANFFKDFIRKKAAANANWPPSIFQAGFTARQVTGQGRCFEFVKLVEGQTVPFPLDVIPLPDEGTARREIQSIELALASRKLARADEPWLIQIMVRLKVVETHLAVISPTEIVHLEHLQNNVKLSGAEVDALFLATEKTEAGTQEVLITLEAKGAADDILEGQILQQCRSTFKAVDQNVIIPMAAKAIAPSEIYVLEFERVVRSEADAKEALSVRSRAIYELVPKVEGVGSRKRGRKTKL